MKRKGMIILAGIIFCLMAAPVNALTITGGNSLNVKVNTGLDYFDAFSFHWGLNDWEKGSDMDLSIYANDDTQVYFNTFDAFSFLIPKKYDFRGDFLMGLNIDEFTPAGSLNFVFDVNTGWFDFKDSIWSDNDIVDEDFHFTSHVVGHWDTDNLCDQWAGKVTVEDITAAEIETTATPEPSTLLLIGCGLAGLICKRKKILHH